MSVILIVFLVVLILWGLSLLPPVAARYPYSDWLAFLAVLTLAMLVGVLHG